MTLPLLLGEMPSSGGQDYCPLAGAIAKRLCEFAGISTQIDGVACDPYWALLEHFDCANAIQQYQSVWDGEKAYRRVRDLLVQDPYQVIVALGRRAAATLGIHAQAPWGEWTKHSYLGLDFVCDVTVIPHPSGRNLVLNAPEMRALSGRVLREAMERANAPGLATL